MFPFIFPRTMPMFFGGPVMSSGFAPGISGTPFGNMRMTAAETTEMRKSLVQNRKQQLSQMKMMAEQYLKEIDEQLAQIDQALEKVDQEPEEAEPSSTPSILAESQAMNESLALRYDRLSQQYQRQMIDRHDMMSDRQQLFYGGMGDFGRPIF